MGRGDVEARVAARESGLCTGLCGRPARAAAPTCERCALEARWRARISRARARVEAAVDRYERALLNQQLAALVKAFRLFRERERKKEYQALMRSKGQSRDRSS